ncbi:MAG: hypothetical protein Q9190_001597 [Brigantiaea leucoxantha]
MISEIFTFDSQDMRSSLLAEQQPLSGYIDCVSRTDAKDLAQKETPEVPKNHIKISKVQESAVDNSSQERQCIHSSPQDHLGGSTTYTSGEAAHLEIRSSDRYPVGNVILDAHTSRRAANRRKKRHGKKGTVAALSTVRGFTPSTSGDDDSDFSSRSISAHHRRELSGKSFAGNSTSPAFRSSSPCPGISALTQQLEALECSSTSDLSLKGQNLSRLDTNVDKPQADGSQRSVSSLSQSKPFAPSERSSLSKEGEDADTDEMTSYEVKLENDFVSSEAGQDSLRDPSKSFAITDIVRKMAATDFEPLCCLGKGSYGTVLLVKHAATGRLYAQKQFRKASLTVHKQLVEQTKTERAILESINRHPFVVKLYYAFQDHEKLYLILEYAQGGELFTRMLTERMFPEDTAAFYMAEMVCAIDHLHNTVGVIYRDLKPENCLLDAEGHLLLTDFGLSKVAIGDDYRCRSMTGTLEYMAPEVILQQDYGQEVDWWSFGILGFDLLTGTSPFHANNNAKVREKILKAKLILPFFLSTDAKDLLTRLLRKKPRERLGAQMPKDLQTIKKHRFFRKIEWKKLERRELKPPIEPLITDPELAENFSNDFTRLPLSPVQAHPKHAWGGAGASSSEYAIDPFGGFSYVASRSLLTAEEGFL